MGKQWKQCQTLFFWAPKSLQMVTAAMKLNPETGVSLGESHTSRVQPPPAPAPGLASVEAPHPARREGEADKWAHASGQPRDSDPLIGLPEALPQTPRSPPQSWLPLGAGQRSGAHQCPPHRLRSSRSRANPLPVWAMVT